MPAENVVIIGAGPAGAAAAIQLKRYGIPFLLLEKERVGGLLWNANLVENYPGFPSGVSGPRLVGLIEKQMQRLGVEIHQEEIIRVVNNPKEKSFLTTTKSKNHTSTHVLIASGTRPKEPNLYIPDACQEAVFFDVHPLLAMKNKQILIVGGGDAAFDYALNLGKKRNYVTILNRGGKVKCLQLLWDRVMAEQHIRYLQDSPVSEVQAQKGGSRLRIRTEADQTFEADYLLFAIGRRPNTDFISVDILNEKPQGLLFAGDVVNGDFRQAAIAAGDGLRAAMQIYTQVNAEA